MTIGETQTRNPSRDQHADWCSNNDVHILFDPKQPPSFHSGRWNRGTNSDVIFYKKIFCETPAREILDYFPCSQLELSLITIPSQVTYKKSSPIPIRNFRKAIWENFGEITTRLVIELLTPSPSNLNEVYKRFTSELKTAPKASIPRGFLRSYIPTWDDVYVGLLNEHQESTDQDCTQKAAAALFDHLNENHCEHWIEKVSNINSIHSSRRAWNSINRLTG